MATNSILLSSTSSSSSSSLQFSSAGEANSYRLKAIVERLNFIMKFIGNSSSIRFNSSEFFNLCFALARGVDYAVTINDVPAVAHRLPSLIKEVYQRRKDITLQPAIMVLMISVKNACKNGWFVTADADELLRMTNELFNSFCMTINVTPGSDTALDSVQKLVSRFYPELKLCNLLVTFEAKPGYEILMSDFQIARNIPPEEKIRLIVVQTDNMETSSCIISPPQVSFIVNGKGVDRRTNVSQDSGPQFPTDITKMLKYGTNIIQAIGYFSGTYLIAIAFMNKIVPLPAPVLEDYVQPVVSTTGSGEQDSDIIVGASRITLNCPISFRRIRTPVKGHLCKHHQCFDYDNFMEMNSRKPSWRCPFCNQPVSFIDLRIDQNMVKILKEAGKVVLDVIISAEGSWTAAEPNGNKDQPSRENLKGLQDCSSIGSASARSFENALAETVDLTMGEEDSQSGVATSPNQLRPINEAVSQGDMHSYETQDTKLFKDDHYLPVHKFLAEQPLTNFPSMTARPPSSQLRNVSWPRVSSSSLSSSLNGLVLSDTAPDARVVGAFFVNSHVITDDVSPVSALNLETLANLEPDVTNSTLALVVQEEPLAENMQLEATFGNSMIRPETERLPIPRHVNRTPIAVQALPVPAQPQSQTLPLNSSKRMRINGPTISISNDFSTAAYQAIQLATDDLEMPALRASDLSTPQQDRDHQHSQSQMALQNMVSLPPTAAISASTKRVASSSPLQRGVGAYRAAAAAATSPSPSLHQLQSSSSLLPSDRHHHRNLSILGRNHHASLIGTYRSNTTLPLGATRELARLVSQQRVRMQQVGGAAAVNLPQPSSSPSSSPPPTGAATAEVAAYENWRPTGRMRGSLTGSAYSDALNHYLAPSTTQPSATPSSRPSSIDNLPPIIASSPPLTAATKQTNDDVGSQPKPGGSSFLS